MSKWNKILVMTAIAATHCGWANPSQAQFKPVEPAEKPVVSSALKSVWSTHPPSTFGSLAFSRDGRLLYVAGALGTPANPVSRAGVGATGDQVEDGSKSGVSRPPKESGSKRTSTVDAYSVGDGRLVASYNTDEGSNNDTCRHLVLSPDGRRIGIIGQYYGLQVFDTQSRKLVAKPNREQSFSALVFAADAQRIITSDGWRLFMHEAGSGRITQKLEMKSTVGYYLAMSPDGKRLALSAKILDATTGDIVQEIAGGLSGQLIFAPDGKCVLGFGGYGVWRWDLTTNMTEEAFNRVVKNEYGHEQSAAAVAFSSDGRWMAVGRGSEVQIWDYASRKLVAPLKKHAGNVLSVAFAPTGPLLASFDGLGVTCLWDLAKLSAKKD